ncbi:MAG: hypothetical protein DRP08_03275 [Candidatus Aenigmatarchaeota archaeon]|nr:MAG: hypothetical protein DRP08_03275 [Candidatus Aenigmarchaeota archaeon]
MKDHDEGLKEALITVAAWLLWVQGREIDSGNVWGEILHLAYPDRISEFKRLCQIAGIKDRRSVRYYTEKIRRRLYE